MAQGSAYNQFFNSAVSYADSASVDAFSRLRVSTPTTIFDAQMTYDLQPLLFEQLTNGSGATVTHDTTNRCALMTFSSTPTGGTAYMQSYEHIRYQPSKSQLVFVTFNFIETKANTLKFAGLSDGTNGFTLELSGSTLQATIYSATSNGNETVAQSSWNIDKMDGTGVSGHTIDVTKTQILVIDFQALYVGRVRMGFDIGGTLHYFHEFNHANLVATPYIQTANLPLRIGMTCTGTVSTTMRYVRSAVVSEGGVDETIGYEFSAEGTGTAANGSRTHILSIRPKTTFNSIVNRVQVAFIEVDMVVTGSSPVLWELALGQAISGTTAFNNINTTYSACEYNTAGTISGSPTIVIDAGYVGASATVKGSMNIKLSSRYPITLDAAGAARALGTISLIVTGLGGASACRGMLKIREVR